MRPNQATLAVHMVNNLLNPLFNFQKYRLAPKIFAFRHQGDTSGVSPADLLEFRWEVWGIPEESP